MTLTPPSKVLLLLILPLLPLSASANAIEQACNRTKSGAARSGLCSCIQDVAQHRLTRNEQRLVSKWFSDPHEAQVVSRSTRHQDTKLWEKYKQFGEAAKKHCS